MIKLNEVSPMNYNNTSIRDPQSSSINIDQTSTTQLRTLSEQTRTKKWMWIVLPILVIILIILMIIGPIIIIAKRHGDAEKTSSTTAATTTIIITATTTATMTTTTTTATTTRTTTTMRLTTRTTTRSTTRRTTSTTTGSCLVDSVLASFKPSTISLDSILLADVNENDKLDIIVGNRPEKIIMIFLNLGNGTFTQSKTVSHEIEPSRITTGDINNDGKLDIIATSIDAPEITIFYNTGNGNFNNSTIILTDEMLLDVKAVDINKDNKLDLIAACSFDEWIFVFLNDGNGVFSKQIRYEPTYFPLTLEIHFGFGNSTFADPIDYHSNYQLTSLETADFNNDNKMNIILSHGYSNKTSILFKTGNGTFGEQKVISNIDQPNYATMIDINSDGKATLVVANDQTIRILYLLC
ncbi:unnamed protein product [Adineta steineri]|uniref:Uncharacterized protein n=1 Tax=Adineta steineri TaxID=433720 RepID=A0A814ZBV4_9BILA|nr:unnamed protein product [Adineta steineri]